MNKLWQKDGSVEKRIERFTIGKDRELDLFLAPYDVMGTLAHIEMLCSIGLLEKDELELLQKELKAIYAQVEAGEFFIAEGVEDVHSQVEIMLTEKLGEMGKKVHSGRSRNDQVLVDLKLYFLAEIEAIVQLTAQLFHTLQGLSEEHKKVLMPGYTHTQVAMPSSFGLWFGAFAESLVDDMRMLQAAWQVADQNPLGSAAGYGSSFPLNRKMTTELLGFSDLSYNVIQAQLGRGKTEKLLAFAMASIATTINKLSSDVVLFCNQNFAFISCPDRLTTGSSIMPHKKNPDVFELLRAKSNRLQSLPFEISHLTTNLISGYHRDLQLVKESLLPAIEDLKDCLEITNYMLENIHVKVDILTDSVYDYLFSVEAVNEEVLNGVPFRDAYKKIGRAIERGEFKARREVNHTHEGSIGQLNTAEIRVKFEGVEKGFDFEMKRDAWTRLVSS
jgi:argininosuccinate lyase